MKAALLVLVSAGLALGADDAAKKDKERVPGTWRVVSIGINGQEQEPEKLKFIFTKDKLTVLTGKAENDAELTWQMDESTKPRILDLTGVKGNVKDQVFEGIYKFEEGKLVICVRGPQGLRQRPTEFATREGSNLILLKLEKVK